MIAHAGRLRLVSGERHGLDRAARAVDSGGRMSHPSTLLKGLEQRAKKRFGQHFLASPGVVRNIVLIAEVGPSSRVLRSGRDWVC